MSDIVETLTASEIKKSAAKAILPLLSHRQKSLYQKFLVQYQQEKVEMCTESCFLAFFNNIKASYFLFSIFNAF